MKSLLIRLMPAALLCLALTACGGGGAVGQTPYDPETAAQALLDSGAFSDALDTVDQDTAAALYGIDADTITGSAVYTSLSAGAEEIAVLVLTDEDAAAAALDGLEARVADQKAVLESYQPDEVSKLDSAIVEQRGNSVLLAVAAAVILLIRKKGRTAPAPLTPAQSAVRDITMLRETHPSLRQAAVDFSLILRKFLVGETKDPALYETQQEFNRRADALTALSTELQGPTRDLLDRMAVLKYEPDTPENDSMVNELADRTVQLINDIDAASRTTQEETDLIVKKPSARTNQR